MKIIETMAATIRKKCRSRRERLRQRRIRLNLFENQLELKKQEWENHIQATRQLAQDALAAEDKAGHTSASRLLHFSRQNHIRVVQLQNRLKLCLNMSAQMVSYGDFCRELVVISRELGRDLSGHHLAEMESLLDQGGQQAEQVDMLLDIIMEKFDGSLSLQTAEEAWNDESEVEQSLTEKMDQGEKLCGC